MRKLKRTLSYFLILIMLLRLLLIPMSVSGEKPAEPGIVRELCELRGTNTETYLRTDGLHECVVFSEDTYISKKYPSANYYTSNYLRTGCDDAYETRRVFYKFRYSDVSDCNKFADRFAQTTMQSGKNVYYAARSVDCSDMLLNMSQLAVIGGDGTLTLNW